MFENNGQPLQNDIGADGEGPIGQSAFECVTIDGVMPLGDQFAENSPIYVPDQLRPHLFKPDAVQSTNAHRPSQTYALLDGAKILGLPEILETSDLESACLFKGKAELELRDVGPWLVRLEEEHKFTRRMFMQGNQGLQIWDNNAGIFLCSSAEIQDLRNHLRRFLKFQTRTKEWLFFRFFEPSVLNLYLKEASHDHVAGFFQGPNDGSIEKCVLRDGADWIVVNACPPRKGAVQKVDTETAERISLYLAADRELTSLQNRGALKNADMPPDQQRLKARSTVAAVHQLGFRGRYHIRYFIAWRLIYGSELNQINDDIQPLLHDTSTSIEIRFQRISEVIRARLGQRMEALFG